MRWSWSWPDTFSNLSSERDPRPSSSPRPTRSACPGTRWLRLSTPGSRWSSPRLQDNGCGQMDRPGDLSGLVSWPGLRLEYAAAEAERVAALYETPEILDVEVATVEAVIETMGHCDRLHAVAHTRLRDDNPMFSALELADGFLNLYDLEGLVERPRHGCALGLRFRPRQRRRGKRDVWPHFLTAVPWGALDHRHGGSDPGLTRVRRSGSPNTSRAQRGRVSGDGCASGPDRVRSGRGRPLPGFRRLWRLKANMKSPRHRRGLFYSVSEAYCLGHCQTAGRTMRRGRI